MQKVRGETKGREGRSEGTLSSPWETASTRGRGDRRGSAAVGARALDGRGHDGAGHASGVAGVRLGREGVPSTVCGR